MRRRIVVATDLSSGSDEAIRQGEARACRDRAALTFVHVASRAWAADGEELDEWRASARAIERAIAQRVFELTRRQASTFEIRIESGPPHAALSQLAIDQHALLVVGASAHPLRPSIFNSVAENIAALGSAPLLIARPRRSGTCVLAIVGPSPAHDEALETALQEAQLARKRLVLLHCLNTEFLSRRSTDLVRGEQTNQSSSATSLLSLRTRERIHCELRRRNVSADLRVVDGDAEYLVPLFAKSLSAETLVIAPPEVGSGTSRATESVLREAPCPVLVARRHSSHEREATALCN